MMDLIPVLLLLAAAAYFGWKIYSGYRDGPDAGPTKRRPHARDSDMRPPQQRPHTRPYTLRRDAGDSSQHHRPQAQTTAHHWENDGYRDIEVVGESHYQGHIRKIVRTQDDNGVAVPCVAYLIPESSNPYDQNAVRVDIDGGTVGYLSKDNAVLFRQRLADNGLPGATTSCSAMIFGGKKTDRTRTPYGVWLEMKRL